jgi:hypothetical protein
MLGKIEILKVLTCLSVIALATPAFAQSGAGPYDPNANPNCSPGQKGCTANYATSDTSSSNPTSTPYSAPGSPNCSPGQPGCSANYPTTDHSGDNPNKPDKQPAN